MAIIDTHNHLWQLDNSGHFSWITDNLSIIRKDFLFTELQQVLIDNNIEGSILVQAIPILEETIWLLDIAEKNECIKGVVGWSDLTKGDAVATDLDYLLQYSKKLKGIRYMSQGVPPEHLYSNNFIKGVQQVGQHGLVYELLITATQLSAAEQLIAQCPNVSFVIEHIAKPNIKDQQLDSWAVDLKRIAENHPNVVCKLSGMITEADWHNWQPAEIYPFIDVVVNSFGENRVLFGSDWPVSLLAGDYQRVLALVKQGLVRHPEIDVDKIFYQNAIQTYTLTTG